METLYSERGIFLSPATLNSDLLLKCLHALLKHHPSIRFTSIIEDDKLQGFRVLFTGAEIKMVLDRKQLVVEDELVPIYPLTTVLTVQDVGVFENPIFEDDVLEAIARKFGKVLDVIKYDSEAILSALNRNFQNSMDSSKSGSWDKKWHVRVDIPEIEKLEAFRQDPEMVLSLPKWNKNLRVAFWCRHCKLCGHFQQSCERIHPDNFPNGNGSDLNKAPEKKILPHDMPIMSTSPVSIRVCISPLRVAESTSPVRNVQEVDERHGNVSPEATVGFPDDEKRLAKKPRNEDNDDEQLKDAKKDEPASSPNKRMASIIATNKIKKEFEEENDYNRKEMAESMEMSSDNNSNLGNTEGDVLSYMSFEDDTKLCIDSGSNRGHAAQKVNYNDSPRKAQQMKIEANSNHSGIVAVPPASTPPPRAHTVLATSSSILGAADTSILSDELQGYINRACEEIGALDRETLDAFLGYVKKKNKPTQIALKYTPNVKQLKDQLQMILTLRYHSKPTNQSKEDAVFIKWLEGLVSRFDNNAPSKRKRIGE